MEDKEVISTEGYDQQLYTALAAKGCGHLDILSFTISKVAAAGYTCSYILASQQPFVPLEGASLG
jgi:hypothetical protein